MVLVPSSKDAINGRGHVHVLVLYRPRRLHTTKGWGEAGVIKGKVGKAGVDFTPRDRRCGGVDSTSYEADEAFRLLSGYYDLLSGEEDGIVGANTAR